MFLTLEDEWELMNVIVKPDVFLAQKAVWVGSRVMVVEGTVQRSDAAVNVLGIQTRIVGQQGHAKSANPFGQRAGNPAEGDKPHCAALHAPHRARASPIPAARPNPPVLQCNVSDAIHEKRQRVIRHIVHAVCGRVADQNASLSRSGYVYVVIADPQPRDAAAPMEAFNHLAIEQVTHRLDRDHIRITGEANDLIRCTLLRFHPLDAACGQQTRFRAGGREKVFVVVYEYRPAVEPAIHIVSFHITVLSDGRKAHLF